MIETVTMVDRVAIPWSTKLNPIWWLQTGGVGSTWVAPTINNGVPYLPSVSNQLVRNILWWFRNPAGNFMGYVIGIEDKNYTVRGSAPVLLTTGGDASPPVRGWRWAISTYAWDFYPYVSYYGAIEFYLGWRPASGGFGLKIVRASKG